MTQEVIAAAEARAAALAAGDAEALALWLHPQFAWTSHLGATFARDEYIARNTSGSLRWSAQTLTDIEVTVVGDTAVLRCVVTDRVNDEVFRMPMTQTWVREAQRWQCLAGHAGPRITQ
ncbi:nuclear transport factor 2 family protein [Kribbella sp. NPDC058245]|uniref:nuclear transport factor 2 family protein n=1 Tax=Kribbella sp. NPDC058245 TaxID=3346399 RepID=UPI0036E3B7DC